MRPGRTYKINNERLGGNNKNCTRLTVVVDRETGKLSDWQSSSATGNEFWAKTDNKCSRPAGPAAGSATKKETAP